jgi:hypothetical protein
VLNTPATAHFSIQANWKAKNASASLPQRIPRRQETEGVARCDPLQGPHVKMLLSIRSVFGETDPGLPSAFRAAFGRLRFGFLAPASRSSDFEVIRFSSAFPGAQLRAAQNRGFVSRYSGATVRDFHPVPYSPPGQTRGTRRKALPPYIVEGVRTIATNSGAPFPLSRIRNGSLRSFCRPHANNRPTAFEAASSPKKKAYFPRG